MCFLNRQKKIICKYNYLDCIYLYGKLLNKLVYKKFASENIKKAFREMNFNWHSRYILFFSGGTKKNGDNAGFFQEKIEFFEI